MKDTEESNTNYSSASNIIDDPFQVDDPEFCNTCGTILPLFTGEDFLRCRLCKKSIPINRIYFQFNC